MRASHVITAAWLGGSFLFGMEFGWTIGLGTALLVYVLMPYGR